MCPWRKYQRSDFHAATHGGASQVPRAALTCTGAAALEMGLQPLLISLLHLLDFSFSVHFTYHYIRGRDPEPLSLVIMEFLLKYTSPVILMAITMGLPEKRPAGFASLMDSHGWAGLVRTAQRFPWKVEASVKQDGSKYSASNSPRVTRMYFLNPSEKKERKRKATFNPPFFCCHTLDKSTAITGWALGCFWSWHVHPSEQEGFPLLLHCPTSCALELLTFLSYLLRK